MDANIEFATAVFTRLATDRETRLERGARLRQQMHDALKRGEKPGGYRPDFLRESALTVIEVLRQIAQEFDGQHPDDKYSVADLMDVLATAAGILKSKS